MLLSILYSDDEPEKQRAVTDTVNRYDCVTSTQVLNELSNVCIKKRNKTADEISRAITEISDKCTILLVTSETIRRALKLHKRYGYAYFDGLMIASALENGCKYLINEDMSDGQVIDELTIKNIF